VLDSPDEVLAAWADALAFAWSLARGARAAELRGRRVKSFDERGIHLYSAEWGAVWSYERVLPELEVLRRVGGDTPLDPVSMRRLAEVEALDEFVREVKSW
jgi:hypothetical protein